MSTDLNILLIELVLELEKPNKGIFEMNAKGKIPILKHNNRIITESAAAVNYITYSYKT